jgi:hypothetical protein
MRLRAPGAGFALCAALVASSQSGCSLTGLSDFAIFECQEHSQCEPLNTRDGIAADACVRYQCAADSVCRLQPLDLDRDGHASTACAGSPGCGGDLPCDDCDDGSAVAFPGRTEVCDGFDNDCSLLVDDVGAGASSASADTVVAGTGTVGWHSYGGSLGEVVPVAFGASANRFFNAIGRDEVDAQAWTSSAANVDSLSSPAITAGCPTDQARVPSPSTPVGDGVVPGTTCTSHDDCSDRILCNGFELCDPSNAQANESGCLVGDDAEEPCTGGETCNEALDVCDLSVLATQASCPSQSAAVAELDAGKWFGVSVQQTGCGGLVRVGYFTETAGDAMSDPGRSLLQRGNALRSTSYRGIDLVTIEGEGNCTGRSREDGTTGARLPAVAALAADPESDRRRPQALAAWLSPRAAGGQPVEVIGLWHEQFSTVEWVNATGDGAPETLEELAVGDVAPVVLAWTGESGAGYLVAYGASGGGIALRFVPSFDDPSEVIDSPPYTTPIMSGATTRRTSPALADLGSAALLETDGEAAGVQLAIGRVSGDRAVLGLVWRDAQGVRFSTLDFDAAAGTFGALAPQLVSEDTAEELAIGFAPSGFVLPGLSRGGRTADAQSSGGWTIAWTFDGGARASRYAELDGALVGPAAMQLGSGLGRIALRPRSLPDSVDRARDGLGLVYHDADAGEFRALGVVCGAP